MNRHASIGGVALWAVGVATLLALFSGCSAMASKGEPVGASRASLATTNGITQNGLSTNGITQNGITQNGITQNGLSTNGITQNGITQNGITQNGMTVLEMMQNDPNVVAFMQYVYSCAMPPDQHMTITIDHPGADGGLSSEVVHFDGALGLAPEWGAADNASCNEACQRWVSACLLARTNAYGEHVKLSLRAPRASLDADGQDRTKLLVLSSDPDPTKDEVTAYPLREGAYFGNVFATQVAADGTLVTDPKYYACSGPGSSLPQLTKRFCSGQGDGCVIFTGDASSWSSCSVGPHSCAGIDGAPGPDGGIASQAVHDCTSPDGTTAYQQVLTVYLAHPITICGNGVCEGQVPDAIYGSDAVPEDAITCPKDCHPGTWAKSVDLAQPNPCTGATCLFAGQSGDALDFGRRLAVGTEDRVIRVLDALPGSGAGIDFGTEDGVLLAPGVDSLIATYTRQGSPMLGRPLNLNPNGTSTRSVTTDGSGNIIVVTSNPLMVSKIDSDGNFSWSSTQFPVANSVPTAGPVTTDGAGNIFVGFSITIVLGATQVTLPAVSKFLPAGGAPVWTLGPTPVDPAVNVANGAMATDAGGNIYFTDVGNIYKIPPDGSAALWTNGALTFGGLITFTGLAADTAGNVYAAGRTTDVANFGGTAHTTPGAFLVQFTSSAGAFGWDYFVPQPIRIPITPIEVSIDTDGNVVWAGGFVGDGTAPNFGPGAFDSEGSPDAFVAALTSGGTFVWAKPLPLYSFGGLDGIRAGHTGQIFMTGGFDGSMLLDSQQLINSHPEFIANQNFFVGAFKAPCGTLGCDTIAPFFDLGTVPGATVPPNNLTDVGHPIIVYATSQAGALVKYTVPLATNTDADPNFDGVNIVCSPRSGSTFPIGVTTVTCNANDPHGNRAMTTFPITVLGTAGPVLLNVPSGVTTNATSPAGAVVTYQPPTATDQIDGPVPVTCVPASGSQFPVGTTTVTCSASDHATPPNTTFATFLVKVKGFAPPVITVPTPGIVAQATSATGAVVTYQASAKDALGTPIPVKCLPPSGSFFPLGTTTVTCSATDASGITAKASFTVSVRIRWFNLLLPIIDDGDNDADDNHSVFLKGSTVPVRFLLGPGISNAVAHLTLAKVTNGVPGPEQNAVSAGNATGNRFRFTGILSTNFYDFDLSTRALSKGPWQLRVNLHDGVSHTVIITLL